MNLRLGRIGTILMYLVVGFLLLWIFQRLFMGGGIGNWETNFDIRSVPESEIISGGVGRDGIPPIDNPSFTSLDQAPGWLQSQSPVIAVEINNDARAYPLAVLTQHEIVNDVIGDQPVAVTFCPLCNSAIAYSRVVAGETLRFGVSGLLRNSDLIMWDNVTESWWQQLTGEAIVGDYTGTKLDIVSSQVVSFAAFQEQYPDGQVLNGSGGFGRSYGRNPYIGYDSSPSPFLFRGEIDDRLMAVERVLAGVINNQAIAYPFSLLEQEQIVNDIVAETPIVVFWQPGATSALDEADINASTDVGMAVMYDPVVDGETLTFRQSDGIIRDDQTGSEWNIFGIATSGELAGTQLTQIHAFPHFWFSWAAFFPDTQLYST